MIFSAAARMQVQRAFVGRERERAELRAALDDADNGRGRLFLISGEPGIGKTRLADELAAEAASRGMRVAWGRCWETAAAPAYWPLVEIVRSLVLEPGRAKPPQTAIPPEIGQLIPEAVARNNPAIDLSQSGAGALSTVRGGRDVAEAGSASWPAGPDSRPPARGRPRLARVAQVRCARTHRLSHRHRCSSRDGSKHGKDVNAIQ